LLFNPVNAWTGTLILAIALDLGPAHARGTPKGGSSVTQEKPHIE